MLSYYDRLATGEQRSAYDALAGALSQKAAYAYASCDADGAKAAYEGVICDNPRYCLAHPWPMFFYDGRSYSLEYLSIDEDRFFTKLAKTESKIREVYEGGRDTSDYALYKAIFDVLAGKIEYDYDAEQKYFAIRAQHQGRSIDELNLELMRYLRRNALVFSPYGALMQGKAVCNGIAKLYKLICDDFGLPCACVQARSIANRTPDTPDSIGDQTTCDHLLNVIEIDGQSMFVDLTNGLATDDLPMVKYDFFCVNYNVLKKASLLRTSDLTALGYGGTDNLYFEKNKLVFSQIGALCRYAANFISKFHNGELRMYYVGKSKSDDELGSIVEDVLMAHCPAHQAPHIVCQNGFINCVIVDR